MGSVIGKAMSESMKAQQENMLATQRMQMERQMQMQNALREQQMAIQIARGRDLFHWWASFYSVASFGCIMGLMKKKNAVAIVPLVPLTFVVGYFYDLAYGSKMNRIRVEAQRIMESETGLLELPYPLPSIEELDQRREQYWKHK